MKKTGNETPAVATTRHRWSIQDRSCSAAKMPKGTAIATARNSAMNINSADAGRRASISAKTGCPVVSEFPKFPCTRSAI